MLCDNCRCRKECAVKTYLKDEPLRVKLLTLLCVDVRMPIGPKWVKKSPRMRVAVGAKKKLIVSRQPIFVNLNSNTMKNTVQR